MVGCLFFLPAAFPAGDGDAGVGVEEGGRLICVGVGIGVESGGGCCRRGQTGKLKGNYRSTGHPRYQNAELIRFSDSARPFGREPTVLVHRPNLEVEFA